MHTSPALAYIKNEFAKRKKKNSKYSIRSFAKQLNYNSANLSMILAGKRPLTFNTARQILTALELQEDKINRLLLALHSESLPDSAISQRYLTEEEISRTAGWQYFAILRVIELPGYSEDIKKIAKKIGCDLKLTKQSIETLLDLNLAKWENGKLIPLAENLTTARGMTRAAVRKCHLEYLEKAKEALNLGPEERDFSGITFNTSAKRMREAVVQIAEFRRSLFKFLSEGDGEPDGVYRLNIQLFPLKSKN